MSTTVQEESQPLYYKNNKFHWPQELSNTKKIATRAVSEKEKLSDEYKLIFESWFKLKNEEIIESRNELENSNLIVIDDIPKMALKKIPDDTYVRTINENFDESDYIRRKRERSNYTMDEYLEETKKKRKLD